ncbi:hypothetical protein [Novosphingobium sp. BL-52-GroH]|uniref:hypothetical protein n=1 Tax=Novosphingobium sp. BL-52-GroH TaxID=3349877 RepID=UPI00384C1B69
MNALDIYRRTLCSAEDGSESAWWYLGTTIATPQDHLDVIVNHVETVMVYGARSLDPADPAAGFRVPWWEIGLFRDAMTGELPQRWTNPLTGATVDAARQFEEGPSGYSIRPAADGGIEMCDAVQAFAQLKSSSLVVTDLGEKVCITQTERKLRSFPDPEGRIPDISEGKAVESKTVLQWLADKADLEGDAPSVAASGMYSFELAAPAWLGFGDMPVRFAVRGLMHKTPMQDQLNPKGWDDLRGLYPQYFEGDQIRPRWA